MSKTIASIHFEMKGSDLKEAWRQAQEFEADRTDEHGRVTFMVRAKGYVMVRRPGCIPFVYDEKTWHALPRYVKPSNGT